MDLKKYIVRVWTGQNCLVPQNARKFLTSLKPVSFSRRVSKKISTDWSELAQEKIIKRQTVNILLVDNTVLP
jgi:hypothetical protein